MQPDVDVKFEWRAPFKPASVSRARIYCTAARTVLILSETPENGSYSLSNGMEIAVMQAIQTFNLPSARLLCIEHLPAGCLNYRCKEEFSLVWFTYDPRTQTLKDPQWYPLQAAEVKAILAGRDRPIQRIQASLLEQPRCWEE